uniref:Uncharacterized protein n=1 Tax=Anguilla anguilla TaxID=7936 RepID=A0A0E9S6B4_ANGAN
MNKMDMAAYDLQFTAFIKDPNVLACCLPQ